MHTHTTTHAPLSRRQAGFAALSPTERADLAAHCALPRATMSALAVRPRAFRAYCRTRIDALTLPHPLRPVLCLVLACVLAHAITSAHAKGVRAVSTHTTHTTHAAHRATLARSPRVAATLAIHGKGNAHHVGAAMLHTWLAGKSRKL